MKRAGAPSPLRRHATTLVLVMLAAGAGLWLLTVERGLPTTAERETRRANLLPSWRRDDVTRLSFVSLHGASTVVREQPEDADDRRFRVERDDRSFAADPQKVDELLSTLELAGVRRAVPEGSVARSAMGLDAPVARVTIDMGSIQHRIAVGSAAAGDGTYVEVDGHGVFVVASALAASLDVRPDALRDTTVVPFGSSAVQRLTIEGEGGSRRLVRAPWVATGGAGFRLEQGGVRASARAVESILQALGAMQAEVFLEAGAGALEEPRVTVTLERAAGPRAVLAVGGVCPGHPELVVVHRTEPSPLAVCVPSSVVPPLLRPRDELMDGRLVGASLDEIVEIRVESAAGVLEMARKGAGFFVRRPAEREVPEAAARAFLDSLVAARGTVESPGAEPSDGSGGTVIRVLSRPAAPGDPERSETLRVGPETSGRRRVRRDEDAAVVLVEDVAVRALLAPELVLRERMVIEVKPERVRSVAVHSGALDQRIQRAGLGVELLAPRGPGLAADETWGLELLDTVAKLEALRWVATKDDGSFGLTPPRAVLDIAIEGDAGPGSERPRTLELGTPTDDGPYARMAGDDAIFIAPPALEDAALRWLVDRGAFRVRPAAVSRLVVHAPGAAPLTLQRRDTALVPSGEGAERPDASVRAARAREGLDELVALEAVAVGPSLPAHGLEAPLVELLVTPTEGAPFRLALGASDARAGESIHYARRSDIDAVFTVAPAGVRALLEAVR